METNDLTLRPITGPGELDLFSRLPYLLNSQLADDLEAGRRHPEWLWVALRGDQVLARVAWWCRPGDQRPLIMDILDLDDRLPRDEKVRIGTQLLATAAEHVLAGEPADRPVYSRFLPPDWRDRAETRALVADRQAVVEQLGGKLFVERLRLEWRAGTPLPEPDPRLTFRSVRDTEELFGMMESVLDGTLDAYSRDDLSRMTPREVAVDHYEGEFARFTTPRDWWRVATLPDGEPVGFVIPARNAYHAIIAYIGVLPEHRGQGYVDGILAEGTRILAAEDVPRVRASTDVGNTPMANAFHRTGYVTFEEEGVMSWR